MVSTSQNVTKNYKRAISIILVILLTFSLVTVQATSFKATNDDYNTQVTNISFNRSFFSTTCGQTKLLNLYLTPSNATFKDVEFSSSNTSVITVNKSGEYTAISTGYSHVTATSKYDNKIKAKVLVFVNKLENIAPLSML